jgi:ATP-dependent RNA helicase DeaD
MESRQESLNKRLRESAREDLDSYLRIADQLLTQNDARTLLAAALKIIAAGEPEIELSEIETTNYDTAHVELPLGRAQGMNPRRVAEYLSANTSLTPRQVGDIEIHSNTCYVEVPMHKVDEVYEAFRNFELSRKSYRPRIGLPHSNRTKRAN